MTFSYRAASSSAREKKKESSMAAFSAESLPWIALRSIFVANSLRIVPVRGRQDLPGPAVNDGETATSNPCHPLAALRTTPIAMTTQLLKRSAGFSLVELMIAVIIMGLLTAIALPIYTKAETRVRGDGAVSFLISTAQKLEDYYALYSTYPATLAEIGIAEPALDPWGNPYQYMPIDIEPPPKKGKIRRDKNMNPQGVRGMQAAARRGVAAWHTCP